MYAHAPNRTKETPCLNSLEQRSMPRADRRQREPMASFGVSWRSCIWRASIKGLCRTNRRNHNQAVGPAIAHDAQYQEGNGYLLPAQRGGRGSSETGTVLVLRSETKRPPTEAASRRSFSRWPLSESASYGICNLSYRKGKHEESAHRNRHDNEAERSFFLFIERIRFLVDRYGRVPAASTGRTRDRTRPMLHKRQKVLARAPSTRDPNRPCRPAAISQGNSSHWQVSPLRRVTLAEAPHPR
jgi:hypothetical protein